MDLLILIPQQAPEPDILLIVLITLLPELLLPVLVILSEAPVISLHLTHMLPPVIMARPPAITLPTLLPGLCPVQDPGPLLPDSAQAATIGCLIPEAGACLMDQPMCLVGHQPRLIQVERVVITTILLTLTNPAAAQGITGMAGVVSVQAPLILMVPVPLREADAAPVLIGTMAPVHAGVPLLIMAAAELPPGLPAAPRRPEVADQAGLTAHPVHANRLHHKVVIMFQHQVADQAGTLIQLPVPAASQHHLLPVPQQLLQVDLPRQAAPVLQVITG